MNKEKLNYPTDFFGFIEVKFAPFAVFLYSAFTVDYGRSRVEFEVDYRFARQRIRLRYSPDMKDIFIIEPDGSLTPIRLLNKQENANVKREKILLCKGDE